MELDEDIRNAIVKQLLNITYVTNIEAIIIGDLVPSNFLVDTDNWSLRLLDVESCGLWSYKQNKFEEDSLTICPNYPDRQDLAMTLPPEVTRLVGNYNTLIKKNLQYYELLRELFKSRSHEATIDIYSDRWMVLQLYLIVKCDLSPFFFLKGTVAANANKFEEFMNKATRTYKQFFKRGEYDKLEWPPKIPNPERYYAQNVCNDLDEYIKEVKDILISTFGNQKIFYAIYATFIFYGPSRQRKYRLQPRDLVLLFEKKH